MTALEGNLASIQDEFHGGLVKRLTAYGSHDEAFSAAREAQRA